MAGEEKRIATNAEGKYYTTSVCNGCGRCFSVAFRNFMYSNDCSYYYVLQQPADECEEADMLQAIARCPLDCIKIDPAFLS